MSPIDLPESFVNRVKSLSWRFWFILGYVIIAVMFVCCSLAFVYAPINEEVVDRQTTNLTTIAQAEAQALKSVPDPHAFVETAGEGTDLRISIIDSDGSVVADSTTDPSTMDNHLHREEVQQALSEGTGSSIRVSETDETERLYVAVKTTYQDETVVLRVSEPSTAFSTLSKSMQATTTIAIVVFCLIAAFVALFSIKQSAGPFRKLDQEKSDFVANASHELKTPVAGIRLLSEAIRDAAEIDDKKSLNLFIDRLDNEAERLQRLVVDLLDLSRLEERSQSDRLPTVDVHSVLITSYMAHKGEAEDKGIDLVLDDRTKPGIDCYAQMEPSDASLVFDNLIENAIMYTDEGSILVSFEPHGNEIVTTVADTGIGIPLADQTRIFERFYRVDKARSREVGGTGLGLSLVRHAIERSHGTIRVKSTLGEGSEFIATLPRIKRP